MSFLPKLLSVLLCLYCFICIASSIVYHHTTDYLLKYIGKVMVFPHLSFRIDLLRTIKYKNPTLISFGIFLIKVGKSQHINFCLKLSEAHAGSAS